VGWAYLIGRREKGEKGMENSIFQRPAHPKIFEVFDV